VVSGTGPAASVIEVPFDGRAREVDVSPEIRNDGIAQIAVSRDGSRVAMVVGPPGRGAVVVAAVSVARGALVINGGAVVVPATQDAQGVAWSGANEILTTVQRPDSRRAVLETTVDGYSRHALTSAGLPGPPTQVAAAPDQPVLVSAAGGVWSLTDHRWHRVATGVDPSYAG
jgi:hypothetical protein